MGAFYGSIHFRTDDRAAVQPVLERLARGDDHRRASFYLAPPVNGWVAAYPSGNGQDGRLAEAAAAQFPGVVVYVLVHDSDVFAYAVYRGGELVDEFNSCPDYSGEVD